MKLSGRKQATLLALFALSLSASLIPGSPPAEMQAEEGQMRREIVIEWEGGQPSGEIAVSNGVLREARIERGQGGIDDKNHFACTVDGPCRLVLQIEGTKVKSGKGSTIVTVQTGRSPLSFFLRDVNSPYPIYIPEYQVVVTEGQAPRSFDEIRTEIRRRGLVSNLQRIEKEPEESFESAAKAARNVKCQTWLGLSRDMRMFAMGERLDWIQPKFHGWANTVKLPETGSVKLPETGGTPVRYDFIKGRGWGVSDHISRRLEDGMLPILRGTLVDEDIRYDLTTFVTLERNELSEKTLRGSHYLVADGYGIGHSFTSEQQARFEALLPGELDRDEETVLMMSVEAVNTARVPRYCRFRNRTPSGGAQGNPSSTVHWHFETANGFGRFESGRVFVVAKLNGKPLPGPEVGILLSPGETATFEVYLPHRPLSVERAARLSHANFTGRLGECRRFWKPKLASAARIRLPEKRVEEMIQAGLLHLDLITFGLEPEATLAPMIGIYSPVGSESSPIIQFMDSMGWHDVARRSLTYFLEKQRPDGLMQNFDNYMLETGAVLWSIGEHYRYTHDVEWVMQIEPELLASCDYILKWRQRNLREDLRGRGYGMLEGKVADPVDPYHIFMLNGYQYLGLKRVAEMLTEVDPAQSMRLKKEADALKTDIRNALLESMGRSPVVPLGDGTWCPTVPPMVEYRGPLPLFAEGGRWFSHGAINIRDSMLGAIWLLLQEVIDDKEPAADFMLNFHNELLTQYSVAFSQPYYSPHTFAYLARGEVKPFLKAYYLAFAGLADRETYTFWEHFYGLTPHKTHEETWYLMQTRRMLYSERGETLDLLPGIPRAWLEDGKRIEIENAASYFGPFSLRVASDLRRNRIEAMVECTSDRRPKRIELHIPHPVGRKASRVRGAIYDPQKELVTIMPFNGHAEITLEFNGN